MPFAFPSRRAALLLAACATALLTACASLQPATPEQAVQQRAQARWQALLAGDIAKSYTYMAPSYRAVVDFERYSGRIGGAAKWLDAEVVRVHCESEEKCTARLKITAQPLMPATTKRSPISTGVDETWLLEDGQWWLYQKL